MQVKFNPYKKGRAGKVLAILMGGTTSFGLLTRVLEVLTILEERRDTKGFHPSKVGGGGGVKSFTLS